MFNRRPIRYCKISILLSLASRPSHRIYCISLSRPSSGAYHPDIVALRSLQLPRSHNLNLCGSADTSNAIKRLSHCLCFSILIWPTRALHSNHFLCIFALPSAHYSSVYLPCNRHCLLYDLSLLVFIVFCMIRALPLLPFAMLITRRNE